MHPARKVDCLGSADQHLLRITPAQSARSTERAMIDDCNRVSGFADASTRRLRRSTGADHYEVVNVHTTTPGGAVYHKSQGRRARNKGVAPESKRSPLWQA